jgi:hypothetical protein
VLSDSRSWKVTDIGIYTLCYTELTINPILAVASTSPSVAVITDRVFAVKFKLDPAVHSGHARVGAIVGLTVAFFCVILLAVIFYAVGWHRRLGCGRATRPNISPPILPPNFQMALVLHRKSAPDLVNSSNDSPKLRTSIVTHSANEVFELYGDNTQPYWTGSPLSPVGRDSAVDDVQRRRQLIQDGSKGRLSSFFRAIVQPSCESSQPTKQRNNHSPPIKPSWCYYPSPNDHA